MNLVLDNCAIIIQARMSSSRFPGKMLSQLYNSMPLIKYLYMRCKKSSVRNILVATSNDKSDDQLYDYCKKNDIPTARGNIDNVLNRYIQAADSLGTKYVVRICGDTPFVDISLTDLLLKTLINEKLDYVSFNRNSCAAGFFSEAVKLEALKKTALLTNRKDHLEHVTKFILENRDKFLLKLIDVDLNPEFVKKVRLTIDYPEDIQRAREIVNRLKDKFSFSSKDVLDIIHKKP